MGQFAQCSISLHADVMFYVRFYSGNFRVTGVLTNLEPFFASLTASVGPDVASAVSMIQESPGVFSHCRYCQNTRGWWRSSLGSRRIFPLTSCLVVCAPDKGSVQAGGGRWLLVTSLGVMAAVIF